MLELGENGELLADSCSPLVEWERSQSRASSWLRICGDGPYLQGVKDKIKVESTTKEVGILFPDKMICIPIF